MKYRLYILFCTLGFFQPAFSQLKTVVSQSTFLDVSKGLHSSRVDDIICDESNMIWMKSSDKLQLWDGQAIHTLEDSAQLLKSTFSIYKKDSSILVANESTLYSISFENFKLDTLYSYSKDSQNVKLSPFEVAGEHLVLIVNDQKPIFIYNFLSKSSEEIELLELDNFGQHLFKINGECFRYSSITNVTTRIPSFACGHDDLEFPSRSRYNYIIENEIILWLDKKHLHFQSNAKKISYEFPNRSTAQFYTSLRRLDKNTLLVGVDNELYTFDERNSEWNGIFKNSKKESLLKTGFYDKIILDKYHNIWAVSVNEGLLKIYNQSGFSSFTNPLAENNFIKNIALNPEEDMIVCSGLNTGITVYDSVGNILHVIDKNTSSLIKSVSGIFHKKGNTFFFNQYNDPWIYILDLENKKPKVKKFLQRPSAYLYYQDAVRLNDDIYYFLFNDLYKYDAKNETLEHKLHYIGNKPSMLYSNDTLWLSTSNGLLVYDIRTDVLVDSVEISNSGYMRSIAFFDDDHVACATDKGVFLVNKSDLSTKQLTQECAYCVQSYKDNLFIGTGLGITHYVSDSTLKYLSKEDGILNTEFNTNACTQSKNGRMFFGGLSGVTSFHPDDLELNESRPRISIKSLSINDELLVHNNYLDKDIPPLNLEFDENNIRLQVGAHGKYDSDKYNYQYYIDGLSSKWIDGKNQTQFDFFFNPGFYKIYFHASDSFDPRAKLKNPLTIFVKKAWWQTWWFYILLTFLFASIVSGFIYLFQRQKHLKDKYNWQLKYERQEDRIKMSQELHDNIGSRLSFLVSSLHGFKGRDEINNTEFNQNIDNLSEYGKQTLDDLRSMMWVLKNNSIEGINYQLKILDFLSLARQSTRNTQIHYHGPSDDQLKIDIPAQISQHSFRTFQEAVHNALKHGRPRNINVFFDLSINELKIMVKDDGLGFDEKLTTSKGHGLRNMRDRIQSLNGRIKINSSKNRGTILEIEIPIS